MPYLQAFPAVTFIFRNFITPYKLGYLSEMDASAYRYRVSSVHLSLFVDAAGIEQMQPILMPGSNTDMRGVQSLLSGYHQKNITILDGISEKLIVTNLPFGI